MASRSAASAEAGFQRFAFLSAIDFSAPSPCRGCGAEQRQYGELRERVESAEPLEYQLCNYPLY